jgi:L-seryl-tRNA(Ser) seleniumtransferase
MISTTRRRILQGAGLGSLSGLWPFSASGARKTARDVYGELGLRPVVNFQGTYTTIGASKQAPDLFEAQAEAARHYVVLEELQDAIGQRISELVGCEDAMVSTGTAGAIAIGTYACVAGTDSKNIQQLPDITGMKSEVIIQKIHRNGYDHAIRTAGVKIVEVEGAEQLKKAINPNTAMIYMLGGTTGDWAWKDRGHVEIADVLAIAKPAGVPVMVDAANMLPPWKNIQDLGALGVDLICASGGKHLSGPQCSGLLAGRKDLIQAAWANSNPHSNSSGRPMKVGREEMVALWLAVERYAKLDFEAIDKQSMKQADSLERELKKIRGLRTSRVPFERTRRVHRIAVEWDEDELGITTGEFKKQLLEGEPRIVVAGNPRQGVQFTVFMNDPGDEKLAARRVKEIFRKA